MAGLLRGEIDGQDIDGFTYFVEDHRGRAQVRYGTPFGGVGNLSTKLDIGPAPWLPPEERGWVRLAIHVACELPAAIPVMALEENMAEKAARLTRRTPARDVYDLTWIASTSPQAAWQPVTGAVPYSAERWRTTRRAADFDEDSIGLLAIPAPGLDDLGRPLY